MPENLIKISRAYLKISYLPIAAFFSMLVTIIFSNLPYCYSNEISMLSPGIVAGTNGKFGECKPDLIDNNLLSAPEECNAAITDKITVFRWNSTLPNDQDDYIIEFSDDPSFDSPISNKIASVRVKDIEEKDKLIDKTGNKIDFNIILQWDEIPNTFVFFENYVAVYWRVKVEVGSIPISESSTTLIYYIFQQFNNSQTILGQVVQSDVNNAIISANVTIQSANEDKPIGNQPDESIETSTNSNGSFLGVIVPLIVDGNDEGFTFPIKVIVNKSGFQEKIEIYTKEEFESLSSLIIEIIPIPPPPPPPPPQTEKVPISPVYQLLLKPD